MCGNREQVIGLPATLQPCHTGTTLMCIGSRRPSAVRDRGDRLHRTANEDGLRPLAVASLRVCRFLMSR
jgi:hypothetical protein